MIYLILQKQDDYKNWGQFEKGFASKPQLCPSAIPSVARPSNIERNLDRSSVGQKHLALILGLFSLNHYHIVNLVNHYLIVAA